MSAIAALEGATVRAGRDRRAILSGMSLSLAPGEFLGLLGGSGCGKTTTARVLAGLTAADAGGRLWKGSAAPPPPGSIGFVFQDPFASLSPRKPLWWILTEPALLARGASTAERRGLADTLLAQVGLEPSFANRFPHELSGGQRQRVAIGRALSTAPELLILDEPTSALDLTVQARILNLLLDLQERTGIAMLMVSHDVAVVRHLAHRVIVMEAGRAVEEGPADVVLATPVSDAARRLVGNVLTVDATAGGR